MIEQSIRIGTQSITLDGEYKSTWPNAWAFYHIKNIGESDALVSTVEGLEELVAPTEEIPSDVIVIPAGASLTVPGRHSAVLLTSGKVQIIANNNPHCPFKVAQGGKDPDSGRRYIFEGNRSCPGWSYALDPANTPIDSTFCKLTADKTLTLSGHYPDGYKNIELIIEAPSTIGEAVGVKIFGASGGKAFFNSSVSTAYIKGQYLIGIRCTLDNYSISRAYNKDVNIVIIGTESLKVSRVFLSKA